MGFCLSLQGVAVLGIALIAMGEEIGAEMALRTFGHLVSAAWRGLGSAVWPVAAGRDGHCRAVCACEGASSWLRSPCGHGVRRGLGCTWRLALCSGVTPGGAQGPCVVP